MTEEELINLEVKASHGVMMIARAKPDGYSLNNSELIVLLAEVRRLRGLIKEAEWPVPTGRSMTMGGLACYHCNSTIDWPHQETCPAFTPDGEVK